MSETSGVKMNLTKAEWLDSVRHIHAQDAAWFFGFVMLIVIIVLWRDARKELREEKERKQKQLHHGVTKNERKV